MYIWDKNQCIAYNFILEYLVIYLVRWYFWVAFLPLFSFLEFSKLAWQVSDLPPLLFFFPPSDLFLNRNVLLLFREQG